MMVHPFLHGMIPSQLYIQATVRPVPKCPVFSIRTVKPSTFYTPMILYEATKAANGTHLDSVRFAGTRAVFASAFTSQHGVGETILQSIVFMHPEWQGG